VITVVMWTLHRRDDGKILGGLVVTGGDFPWLNARVNRREGLDELRPLFAEEVHLLDGVDDDVEPWEGGVPGHGGDGGGGEYDVFAEPPCWAKLSTKVTTSAPMLRPSGPSPISSMVPATSSAGM
jgi:hypothetical protein